MNRDRMRPGTCAVCGAQTNYHAHWFLVAENRWLDHLRILSWHPALADQAEILNVCGDQHLQLLMEHWLTHANLNFQNKNNRVAPLQDGFPGMADPTPMAVSRLLGELSVARHPRSHVWTGSSQILDCILTALTGREAIPRPCDYSLAPFHPEQSMEMAYAHSAGRA